MAVSLDADGIERVQLGRCRRHACGGVVHVDQGRQVHEQLNLLGLSLSIARSGLDIEQVVQLRSSACRGRAPTCPGRCATAAAAGPKPCWTPADPPLQQL